MTMLRVLIISSIFVSVCETHFSDDFQVGGRVIGGHSIDITYAPYQASYELNGQQKCGAVVVSNSFALSAAHCSISDAVSQVAIRVGTKQRGNGGTVHKASQIINHPNYATFPSTNYDISLIKVATPFAYSASVQAIPLATSTPKTGSGALVSGWGATTEDGTASDHLMQVRVVVVGYSECNDAYPLRVTSQMLCAGDTASGGKDACLGDAGGPLVASSQLIGVASWGQGCGRAGYPGVYASVPALRDWIINISNA